MFRISSSWNTFKNEVEKFSDKAVVLFHYLLLVVSVSGNFLIRSDKCVANFPYYVSLMWAPEAKSSSIARVWASSFQTGPVEKLFHHKLQAVSSNLKCANYANMFWPLSKIAMQRLYKIETICKKVELEFMTGQFVLKPYLPAQIHPTSQFI